MKKVGEHFWAPWAFFIACGLALATVLIYISPTIFEAGLRGDLVQILDVLIGIFIIGGFGLMLVEKSRYIGLLLLTLSVPSLVYFVIQDRILMDSLILGFVIGIAITGFLIYKIRFDWLAKSLKYFVDAFLVLFIAYMIWVIWENYSSISQSGTLVFFIVAILLAIGLYVLLSKNLFAVTSSDALVIGPTGSGKSYFIAALAVFLVRNQSAHTKSIIFSPNEDAPDRLSIANIASKYQRGQRLDATLMNEMAYYVFTSRFMRVIPVDVTCLDYAGGRFARGNFDLINETNYTNTVQLIAQLTGRSPAEIQREFGNITFFQQFFQNFRADFYSNFDDIVPAFIYARLLKAGKIIFLIDGERLQNANEGDEDWTSYLVNIDRLVGSLGENKDYAFAITKADMIPEIKEKLRGGPNGVPGGVPEDSKEALEIEKSHIESLFKGNIHLASIYNTVMANSFIRLRYIEGFLISVDAHYRETNDVLGYYPWRIKEIARYILKL